MLSRFASLHWRRFRELLRFAFRHGPRRTLQLLRSVWKDRRFDSSGGFETGGAADLQPYKQALPALAQATIYGPTRARALQAVLRQLPVGPHTVLVDLGCGKGRAMIVAVLAGVRHVKGVELVPDYARICRTNLNRLAAGGVDFDWQVLHTDIRHYEVAPEDNLFYLYDPCTWPGVVSVLHHILDSWRCHPRSLHVIYHNNLIDPTEMQPDLSAFDEVGEQWFDGNRFFVFHKRAAESTGRR